MISGKRSYMHLAWTSSVGLVGVGFLFFQLGAVDALDPITLAVVTLVVAVWLYLQAHSFLWQSRLKERTPEPASDQTVPVGEKQHLPEGASVELAEKAMANQAVPSGFSIGATTLISLGLAGTFLGLTLGLFDALPLMANNEIESAIQALLDGAKLAFVKSLAGILLAMLWGFRLIEVRAVEDALKRSIVAQLDESHPPVTPERLLAAVLRDQQEQVSRLEKALVDLRSEEHQALTGVQRNLRGLAEVFQKQTSNIEKSVREIQGDEPETLAGLRQELRTLAESVEQSVRLIRGGDEPETLASLRQELRALADTLRDLAEKLPEQIGTRAGTSVGSILQPRLEDLSRVLQALGTTVKEAISDALKANMGDEVSELRTALVHVASALATLPGQIAAGSQSAARTLSTASETGAQQLSSAAAEVAQQTHAATLSVKDLREALAATQRLVEALQGGGVELRDAFADVVRPLQQLPGALESARTGVEAAGVAATGAADHLRDAGNHAATRLHDGATALAQTLEHAAAAAGGSLTGAASEASQVMQSGGSRLASEVQTAGQELRDGIALELVAIRDSLRVQRDAQQQLAEAWNAERATLLDGAREARRHQEAIQASGEGLVGSLDGLRLACEQTVEKLQVVTGDQRVSADTAIQQLLAAVGAFSQALEENKGTIRDASLQSVASTEQVTATAAREVAKALMQGAAGLTAAMARAEQLGQRIDAQAAALARSVEAAEAAAASMQVHGSALAESGRSLTEEVSGLTAPLIEVRGSLRQVAPAVHAAATAMEDERKAITGLGQSLRDQAALISEQEAAVTTRTVELRKLHEVLGQQWSGHVGRMSEAHQQVRAAWQEAMRAASEGVDRNAEQIARYAERVEKALGLGAEVSALQESLQDLADALGELRPTLSALGGEVVRLRTSVDHLEDTEA